MVDRQHIVNKYLPKTEAPQDPVDADAEQVAPGNAYGFVRGGRERASMVEFRPGKGAWESLGYAWLERVQFQPAGQLRLVFVTGHRVLLTGRNLGRLRDLLTNHRLTWVQETDALQAQALDEDAAVVTAIHLQLQEEAA